jgi:hypothetical protein
MEKKMKTVICDSGLEGWRHRLQENYSSFEEFDSYDAIYKLAQRLGYDNTQDAWEDNPMIQGSTKPSDFRASN